jgi:hypothetical protein
VWEIEYELKSKQGKAYETLKYSNCGGKKKP